METSQNKRADLPASKASRPIAPLKPNEMQHSKEFPATQLRAVSNKSPFVRTGFQQKQARQSPGLQHSMVAWRGFEPPISALRGRRPKPLDDQAKNGWGGRSRTLTYGTRNRCPAIRRHPNITFSPHRPKAASASEYVTEASAPRQAPILGITKNAGSGPAKTRRDDPTAARLTPRACANRTDRERPGRECPG